MQSAASGASPPATEWMAITSSDSSSVSAGRIVAIRRASIVFPAPGGPMRTRPCAPAAAISSARLALCCPTTSERSWLPARACAVRGGAAAIGSSPARSAQTSSPSVSGAERRTAETSDASATLAGGSTSVAPDPSDLATERAPRTGRRDPSSPSSPTKHRPATAAPSSCRVATSTPRAIGRSKAVPVFGMSAGAR